MLFRIVYSLEITSSIVILYLYFSAKLYHMYSCTVFSFSCHISVWSYESSSCLQLYRQLNRKKWAPMVKLAQSIWFLETINKIRKKNLGGFCWQHLYNPVTTGDLNISLTHTYPFLDEENIKILLAIYLPQKRSFSCDEDQLCLFFKTSLFLILRCITGFSTVSLKHYSAIKCIYRKQSDALFFWEGSTPNLILPSEIRK